ncbi:insulinase family protein [Patescibacteria group bacterium]|nr:insulinase family protein [Patescibacteria group bacterium]MBU1705409.1 insulinase family protein [Patescibacteria group bacterium]
MEPKIDKVKLANGATVLLINYPGRNAVYFDLAIGVGSRQEKVGENGLAHLVEHLMSRQALRLMPESVWGGHYLAREFDGSTLDRRTNYELTAQKQDVALAMRILGSCLRAEKITARALAEEKQRIFSELSAVDDDPHLKHLQVVRDQVFANPALARWPGGRVADLKKITLGQIKDFVRNNYRPENTVLTVAGDLKKKEVIELAEKYCRFSAGASQMSVPTEPSEPGKKSTVNVISPTTSLRYATFSWLRPALSVEDNVLAETVLRGYQDYLHTTLEPQCGLYDLGVDITAYADAAWVSVFAAVPEKQLTHFLKLMKVAPAKFVAVLKQKQFSALIGQEDRDLALGADFPRTVANNAAWYHLTFGRVVSLKEQSQILAKTDAKMARELFISIMGS